MLFNCIYDYDTIRPDAMQKPAGDTWKNKDETWDCFALHIRDLKVVFKHRGRELTVVNRISAKLAPGRRMALVGESGCGKSVLGLSVFGLLPPNAAVSGNIRGLGHENLLTLSPGAINTLRGRRMVFIPQNPHGSLNPVYPVGKQLAEAVRRDSPGNVSITRHRVFELLSKTGFSQPEAVAARYPHQLSGGQAQRVLLAIGLAADPEIVIADEPTKGLDNEAAVGCLHLMNTCFEKAAVLFITHDMKAAADCHEAAVMYAGEIVETGPAAEVFAAPMHPYGIGLMRAHPANGLHPIPGAIPDLAEMPAGCRFHPRCPKADTRCRREHPELSPHAQKFVRCFHAGI
jgi:peptide/nickel transport system ATP-binding protein